MNVKINNYSITSSFYSDEEYGSWYVEHTNSIRSISISKKNGLFDLVINDDIDTTKSLYLLYAEYSQGNSFGNESGCIEYIKLFKSLEEANLFKNELEKFEKYSESNFIEEDLKPSLFEVTSKYPFERSFEYFGEKFYLPWGGYFESLDLLDVIELNFESKNK